MTSGITSGAVTMPASVVRPRNLPKRASTSPANVPMITAPVAVTVAMRRLSHTP